MVDGACSAANWSEVAQKIRASGHDWDPMRALLMSYPLHVEPVLPTDAEHAATLWRLKGGLSLADRLFLATGQRLNAVIWTAGATWEEFPSVRRIR